MPETYQASVEWKSHLPRRLHECERHFTAAKERLPLVLFESLLPPPFREWLSLPSPFLNHLRGEGIPS